ncbi:MAG: prolipoprotein diacylglyceryl transferase [Oscillospiraceae bacterium]|nr:prolipoprotein diacylglyceryl transferase [Oscillospiraceae bacterium]
MEVYFRMFSNPITVNSTALQIGGFTIQWYGVLIAFGFLLAVLFGGRMAYKWKMNLDKMVDVLIGGTVGGVVGARLYYVLFNLGAMNSFADIFRIWEGGLAIYGGIIGGLLGAFIVTRINKLNFLNLMDLAAMSFLIGQGIGRWGNFTNQEAFGGNTNLPWGMWSQATANYIAVNQGMFAQHGIEAVAGTVIDRAYVHPTFLYESLWVLLGFGLLYLFCRKWRSFSGQLILLYGMWYGAGRFFIEGLRLDPLFIGGSNVRVSQLLSGLIVLGCAAAFIYFTLKFKKNPQPIEGIDFFPGAPVEEEEIVTEDAAQEEPVEEVAEENDVEEPTDEPIA